MADRWAKAGAGHSPWDQMVSEERSRMTGLVAMVFLSMDEAMDDLSRRGEVP